MARLYSKTKNNNRMVPVFSSVSLDSYKDIKSEYLLGFDVNISPLSDDAFILEVTGVSMMPFMKIGSQLYIEPLFNKKDLTHKCFVLAQHKTKRYGEIKQVLLNSGINDAYLVQTNNEICDVGVLPMVEFDIIGIVDRQIEYFR